MRNSYFTASVKAALEVDADSSVRQLLETVQRNLETQHQTPCVVEFPRGPIHLLRSLGAFSLEEGRTIKHAVQPILEEMEGQVRPQATRQ
jgi:hypothetical protein